MYQAFIEIGIIVIAPACTLFTVLYTFEPWWTNHFGRAFWLHAVGSMILFDVAILVQFGLIPENYPGHEQVTAAIVLLWALGWVYMAVAVPLTRRQARRRNLKEAS
jgi:hypothetical protein